MANCSLCGRPGTDTRFVGRYPDEEHALCDECREQSDMLIDELFGFDEYE